MLKIIMPLALLVPITACATAQSEPHAAGDAACNDAALSSFIGTKASEASAADMLKVSRARHLRWAGPGMALTMDYRADRLTVSYDSTMGITSARCG
ncbi:peptidase inhibitor I78 [Sphingobium sp. SCG-1]|uniref:I78 family peptidase inhibitor n=1 Tax=Sphingobium sp. SCG-1 TaxID=2072936 RepID=UPI000CD6B160|nr:I78 family peptidase inhibitor [Sphingobium sp. SCG-1]AUW58863.1 peptidase inhibitor I78 [Sphingobium sp. SCG-1]